MRRTGLPGGRESANVRNGSRPKTVLTAATGPVEIEVPRDRDGSFEPVIVKKRQRRLAEVDEVVLSLSARGLTTGEISAHFAQIYGASVSKETISRITDRVVEEMVEWRTGRWSRSTPRSSSTRSVDHRCDLSAAHRRVAGSAAGSLSTEPRPTRVREPCGQSG